MAGLSGEAVTLEAVRLAAAIIFLVVGAAVWHRDVDPRGRLARTGFATWWFGLGTVNLLSLPLGLGLDVLDHGLLAWRVLIYTFFPILFVALAGLVYYLVYIYTGRHRLWIPVALYYVALSIMLVWLVEGFGPHIGPDPETAEPTVLFDPEHPRPVLLAFSLALSLPPLVAILAYAGLFVRVADRRARFRIALVSTGIGLWFGYSVLNTLVRYAANVQGEASFAAQVLGQLVGLVASLMVLVAFKPPRWLRERARATGQEVAEP